MTIISYEEFKNITKKNIRGKDLKKNNLYYIDFINDNDHTIYSGIVERHIERSNPTLSNSVEFKNVNIVTHTNPYYISTPNFSMSASENEDNELKFYELVEPLAQDLENKKNNIQDLNQFILEKKAEPVNDSNVSFIGEDYRESRRNFENETAKWPPKSGGKTKRKNRKLSIRSKQKGKKSRKNRKFSRKSKKN